MKTREGARALRPPPRHERGEEAGKKRGRLLVHAPSRGDKGRKRRKREKRSRKGFAVEYDDAGKEGGGR